LLPHPSAIAPSDNWSLLLQAVKLRLVQYCTIKCRDLSIFVCNCRDGRTSSIAGGISYKVESKTELGRKSAALKQVVSFAWAGEEGHVFGKGLAVNAALKSKVLKMTRSKK
jgi:hypothetical protein